MANEKILIVEDDDLIGQHLAKMLVGLGYRVPAEIIRFGEEVVERVGVERPDLILMDIELGGAANGVETTRALAQKFAIPVVYLTSFSNDFYLDQAEDTDSYGYLIKPVKSRDLNAAVRMALHRHQMEIRLKESEAALRLARVELEKRVEERTAELVASNREIRRHAAGLEALAAVSSALRKATTLPAMLSILVDKTAEIFQADTATLVLNRGDKPLVMSRRGGPPSLVLEENCPALDLLQMAIGDAPCYCEDAGQPASPWQDPRFDCLMAGLQSYAVIPLITAHSTVGIWHLGFRTGHEFSPDEKNLLRALAEMTGNAFHRAIVMESLEQRVADRTRELFTLYRMTLLLREPLSLEAILNDLLEETQDAMYCDLALIHLLEEGEDGFKLAGQRGSPFPAGLGLEEALIRQVIEHKEYLLKELPGFRYVGVPMRAMGRVVGVLSILVDAGRQFSREDIALLDSIADHAAATIEAIKLRKKSEQSAVTAERARLARQLHDSVTQSLYSLNLFTEAARANLSAGKTDRTRQYLDQISDIAQQALKEMRMLIYALRPPVLERERLVGALHSRLDAVERRAGVQVRFLVENLLELPLSLEEELYWIALEALNNSLKHARARNLTVCLRAAGETIELEIGDDGVGFDPQSVASGGMGLANMRERARKIGGELIVQSSPEHGATIKVLAPLVIPKITSG